MVPPGVGEPLIAGLSKSRDNSHASTPLCDTLEPTTTVEGPSAHSVADFFGSLPAHHWRPILATDSAAVGNSGRLTAPGGFQCFPNNFEKMNLEVVWKPLEQLVERNIF